jgi:hypothetical protein
MVWDRHLHALLPRNPIVVRDLRRQQQTTSFLRGFIESVGIVAVALCFTATMLFSVVNTSDLWAWRSYLVPIQLLAWTFHVATALRLLVAGAFIITPDEHLLGSDDIRLTPLTNWQLFMGKWWAALHQVRGWLLALGLIQLGIVVSTGFGLLMTVDWGASCGTPCVVTVYGLYRPLWFTPTLSLFIVASAIGIAFLEAVCCTALGMAVTMLMRSKIGLVCAISLRFAPVAIFSFFPDYPWAFGVGPLMRFSEYTWFSFADGGTGAIVQLADPRQSSFERGVLGLCAVVVMFLTYLSLSLVTAWVVMRRSRR